jgi:cobalt/nickel transport system permease protein
MHIPDGFLSPPVWAALDVISLPAVGYVANRAKRVAEEHDLPLLGVLGAFVFAAQMINFPVGAGTSAHLLGGALLASTVGPAAAIVVMTAVLVIQAFVFQDGGILALGANVFNLAIAGCLAGYLPYRLLGARFRDLAVFLGGALSVLASSYLALAELAISGVPVTGTIAAASAALFGVNAAIEGVITLVVIRALGRMNPAWIRDPQPPSRRTLLALGAASTVLAAFGFALASAAPDTLDSTAEHLGIATREFTLLPALMSDYQIGGIPAEWLAKSLAGIIGLALVYLASTWWSRRLARRSP